MSNGAVLRNAALSRRVKVSLISWCSTAFVICCCLSGCGSKQPLHDNHQGSLIQVQSLLQSFPEITETQPRAYLLDVTRRVMSGEKPLSVDIRLLNTSQIIAASFDKGLIILSSGFCLQLQSEAELAFVLAHELSHAILQHGFTSRTSKRVESQELESDAKAIELLFNAGYQADAAIAVITREVKENYNSAYPSRLTRIQSLLVEMSRRSLSAPGILNTRSFEAFKFVLRNLSQTY